MQAHHAYISCCESTIHTQSQHFHNPLADLSSKVDIEQLRSLFEQSGEMERETCSMIDRTHTRRQYCGM